MSNGTNPTWEETMWEFLCWLYRLYGGNCDDLARPTGMEGGVPDGLHLAIAEARSLYDQNGDPTFDTEQERLDFLKLLDDTEAHLALPENTLSADDNTIMATLISDLRSGATPPTE